MDILIIGKNGFVSRNLYEYFMAFSEDSFIDVDVIGSRDLNLLDEDAVREKLSSRYYDVIIDTAIYNPRVGADKEPDKELEYDLRMFHNIARCHDMYGKLIYFGSGAEYDKRYPICSAKETLNKESGQPRHIPATQYGLAKYIIGQEIESGIYGADNIYNLRIFGLYGKYENWKTTFISGACCKAMKNLPITIRRDVYFDYLYIGDFCRMIRGFLDIDKPKYHTYNITSGKRVRLTEIADIVKKVSGKNIPIIVCNEGLANEYTADSSRLVEEIGGFGFESMEESIRALYSWYQEHEDMIDMESLLY